MGAFATRRDESALSSSERRPEPRHEKMLLLFFDERRGLTKPPANIGCPAGGGGILKMSVNRWKLVAMPVLMLGLASPMLVNCGALPGGGKLPGQLGEVADAASGCDEMKSGGIADLSFKGDAKGALKIKSFLEAAASLSKATIEMDASLAASCTELGRGIGMKDDELKSDGGEGKAAEKVCAAVAAKLDGVMKANAEAKIGVEFQEPKCYVDVTAMQDCFAKCDAAIEPGKLEASCTGGEIRGKCDAECKGKCTVDAGAACTGTCSASCSGKCELNFNGRCGGNCDGKCDGKNAKGKCAGTCEGKCDAQAEGSCGGTCEGKCSGTCEMKAAAKCEGSCSGGCSAEIKSPQCSGEFRPPKVDATCQTNCGAKAAATASCDPPGLKVVLRGKVTSDAQKVATALQASLPGIVKLQLGTGAKLATALKNVAGAGAAMGDAAVSAGGKAIACVKSAVEMTAGASASISVDVKVSASVSGSAKAGS